MNNEARLDYIIAQYAERRQPTDKQKYHRDRREGHMRHRPEDSPSDSSDIEIVELLTNEPEEPTNARPDRRQRVRKENSPVTVPSRRPRRGALGMGRGKERAPPPEVFDEDSQHECVPSFDVLQS